MILGRDPIQGDCLNWHPLICPICRMNSNYDSIRESVYLTQSCLGWQRGLTARGYNIDALVKASLENRCLTLNSRLLYHSARSETLLIEIPSRLGVTCGSTSSGTSEELVYDWKYRPGFPASAASVSTIETLRDGLQSPSVSSLPWRKDRVVSLDERARHYYRYWFAAPEEPAAGVERPAREISEQKLNPGQLCRSNPSQR